jgi:hypothetical protein
MVAKCGIILDGYTIDHTIPESPGFYPAVTIKFRPATVTEFSAAQKAVAEAARVDPAKGEKIAAEAMAKQIVGWDLKDHNGNDVTPTAEMLTKLEPNLSGEVYKLVMGMSPVSDREAALKN